MKRFIIHIFLKNAMIEVRSSFDDSDWKTHEIRAVPGLSCKVDPEQAKMIVLFYAKSLALDLIRKHNLIYSNPIVRVQIINRANKYWKGIV